jgi:hypothetical protein
MTEPCFDCLLVTTEGVKRAWVIPVVSEEIRETMLGALDLVVVHHLDFARLEMTTDADDLVRLEVRRSKAGRSAG